MLRSPPTTWLSKLLWLWPGLRSLWLQGSWTSLAIAVASAWMLCGLLAITLVWTQVATSATRNGGWIVISLVWIISALWSHRADRKKEQLTTDNGLSQGQDLFSEAISEYLKGNYLEAEQRTRSIIAGSPRDAEARLLLATLLRRTGRTDEACGQLRRLAKLETASNWHCEIERELAMIESAITKQQAQTNTANDVEANKQAPDHVADNIVDVADNVADKNSRNRDSETASDTTANDTTVQNTTEQDKETDSKTTQQSDASADMTKAA